MQHIVRLPNAIWWLQFRLLKPTKVVLLTVGYPLAAMFCAYWWWRVEKGAAGRITPARLAADVLGIVAAIQCGLMVLGGAGALHRGLLRDFTSGMMESHRLSPMGGTPVVIGYLFGPTAQILLLWAAGIVFGAAMNTWAGHSTTPWLVGNALLFSSILPLWAFVICLGVGRTKPVNPMGILIPCAIIGGLVMTVLPALGPASGGLGVVASYHCMTGHFENNPSRATLIATTDITPLRAGAMVMAHCVIAAIWLAAARNRYRQPERAAFHAPLGMLWLTIWCPLAYGSGAVAALLNVNQSRYAIEEWGIEPEIYFVDTYGYFFAAAMISGMLLAILPLMGAVKDRARLLRGAATLSWTERVNSRLTVIAAAVVILGPGLLAAVLVIDPITDKSFFTLKPEPRLWLFSGLALLFALFAFESYARRIILTRKRPTAWLVFFVLILWVAPIIADLSRAASVVATTDDRDFILSWLFGCSPIGTIIGCWSYGGFAMIPGLVLQAFVAIVTLLAAWRSEKNEVAKRLGLGIELPGVSARLQAKVRKHVGASDVTA